MERADRTHGGAPASAPNRTLHWREAGILRLKRHFESLAEGILLRYMLENYTAVSAHGIEK
jgi:hypothetical protein